MRVTVGIMTRGRNVTTAATPLTPKLAAFCRALRQNVIAHALSQGGRSFSRTKSIEAQRGGINPQGGPVHYNFVERSTGR
jgi:hypothetical protein